MQAGAPWFQPPAPLTPRRVAVIGAGLAGCSISYELMQSGCHVTLIEQADKVASAASSNPQAILKPHISRSVNVNNTFNLLAFTQSQRRLKSLLRAGHHIDHAMPGVVQLLQKSAAWPALAGIDVCTPERTCQLTNLPIRVPSLYFAAAGWINAEHFCQALVASTDNIELRLSTTVNAIHPHGGGWRLTTNENVKNKLDYDAVVFSTGVPQQQFDCLQYLPLIPNAGQTTLCRYLDNLHRPTRVITGKGFLVPCGDLCTIGATHQRNSTTGVTENVANNENLTTLASIHTSLPNRLEPVGSWRGVRLGTPDRLPLVGALPDFDYYIKAYSGLRHGPRHQSWPDARYVRGLYVLTGLGSRGLVHATLGAQLLSSIICGKSTLTQQSLNDFYALVHPARFTIRGLRRSDPLLNSGL